MGTQKVKGKLNNIEFIRFFFAAAIIYFHLLHSFMMPYTGESVIYQNLAEQSKYAKYIVECFFIISGYCKTTHYPPPKTLSLSGEGNAVEIGMESGYAR